MAKSNDMPEFHSVKAYLTESLTENMPTPTVRQPPSAYASNYTPLTGKGGNRHV
ncbi:hypothetical protein [Thalassomonas actiniarum]|uniref:Uncharacterized protein n=1 Tax=Thalassomonas actiniarum TaxID=485447 RepID=A0AAE9YNA4_9GAMM|nr:hypothetical protein [Thalassomonas actiniarum]WDD98055.1 hypothetical protein SG35_022650 [Thalassomonas actiniarum]